MVALAALVAYAIAFVVVGVVLYRNFVALISAWLGGVTMAVSVWWGVTRRGVRRILAVAVAAGSLVLVTWALLSHWTIVGLLVAVGTLAIATGLARTALRAPGPTPGPAAGSDDQALPPPRRPFLLINPRSGGGKAERADLAGAAGRRGIATMVLGPNDDLADMARAAISRGADALGMAGGDGSQAVVAEVAMEHGVPFVCIPAGTRNHFALDLGIDRDDLVGSLAAFEAGWERRIDLGRVNDRTFVNNVSLGVYAMVVRSPDYRDDKLGTVARMLPALLGPDAEPFDLEFDGPTGSPEVADLILISNNVYDLDRIAGFGTRVRLDAGVLGIVAVAVRSPADLAELVALQTTGGVSRARGWQQWTTTSSEVRSSRPIVAAVDGEALELASPLRVAVLPSALRVRIAAAHPGRSPAAARPRVSVNSLARLCNLAFGRRVEGVHG